jgi:RNA-directed DNA polymerase
VRIKPFKSYAAGSWRSGVTVEVDVRKYFDTIPRTQLREVLARRVNDGVVRKLIDKWLNAGVFEAGQIHYPDAGTPQGGVATPRTQKVTSNLTA